MNINYPGYKSNSILIYRVTTKIASDNLCKRTSFFTMYLHPNIANIHCKLHRVYCFLVYEY